VSTLGRLYLLPVPISDADPLQHIPVHNLEVVRRLTRFVAEDAKTARRSLKIFGYPDIAKAEIFLLNEHTKTSELPSLMKDLEAGMDVGLMSDAGCPGIADPGAAVVRMAHEKGIQVLPLAGPSAIVLSIMASGFNGQNFAFVGYLPIDKPQKIKRLKELEQLAIKGQAQFFIETPYRNDGLLEVLLDCLSAQTLLFIGKNIGAPDQLLCAKPVSLWRHGEKPALHKVPVVFGIYAS
jgi:16S rRNA (cytidine1402-2'-O)-methyltransferase